MKKRTKKFRLWKIPRYLAGSVDTEMLMSDLKAYNEHRYRVFAAKSMVDNLPPKLNPYIWFDKKKFVNDVARLQQIDSENKDILKRINNINKLGGKVDSFNPKAYNDLSKWNIHETNMKKIYNKNLEIYDIIMAAESNYSTKVMNEYWKHLSEQIKRSCKLPVVIFDKPNLDLLLKSSPSISGDLNIGSEGDRPLCFLEFGVKDGPLIGKVIIQLYHDYTPVTVQNFLSLCCGDNKKLSYKNCVIHRIVRGKYMVTGDITMGSGRGGCSIYGKSFAEENHVLKHTKPGVLSMVRVGEHQNNSQFCISFNKLEELDRKNVVFGKVIKGISKIFIIEEYGRKIGKPIADIVILNCGEVKSNPGVPPKAKTQE